MWRKLRTDEFERKHKWYAKKRKNELTAVMDNFELFLNHLDSGGKPQPLFYGFCKAEPGGFIRIKQTGAGVKLAETRLYLYTDVNTKTLYLLTIGDKRSQSDDIQYCRRCVQQIRTDLDDLQGQTDA